MCKGNKMRVGLIISICISLGLFVAMIYFVVQSHSNVSQKLGECQGQIKVLEAQGRVLREQVDRAKDEVTALESELLRTQKDLQETQKRRESCSRRMRILQNSTVALKARILQLGGSYADLEAEGPGEQETNPTLLPGTWDSSSKAQGWSPGVAGYLLPLALSVTGILL